MKKIIAILVAGLFTTGVFAQAKKEEPKKDKEDTSKK